MKIYLLTGIFVLWSFGSGAVDKISENFFLASRGKANCCIVLPVNASKAIQMAGNTLAKYLEKSSGVKFERYQEDHKTNANLIRINLGLTDYVKNLNLKLKTLDEDGFIITFPDSRNIVIAGCSDYGVEFGVYEFLEQFLGIRWLFPGELGEHIPFHKELIITPRVIKQQPAYLSRLLSGHGDFNRGKGEQYWWARHNRMRGRVKFSHSLWQIFPPDLYGKSHPEYYPEINGKRLIPSPKSHINWQPCFSATGSVETAIEFINIFFEKNTSSYYERYPSAYSFSLGVNDILGYCECAKCKEKDNGKLNQFGFKNHSNSYYEWCNAIIAGVRKKYPEKYFGCLAYFCVASPPDKKLDSRLIPYITEDRMQWVSPEREKASKKLLEEWQSKASAIGWYDYIYGSQYHIPRIYFHKMGDYLKYGNSHKIKHFYAEAYPGTAWKEGPKLYVTLKLLWNPQQDVDELLDEWYDATVGKAAAPYLKTYFQLWEDFWTKKVPKSKWFNRKKHFTYLPFDDSAYLDLLTEDDMTKCKKLLQEVLKRAKTAKQKQRAAKFLDSFNKICDEKVMSCIKAQKASRNSDGQSTIIIDKELFTKKTLWSNWQRSGAHGKFKYSAVDGVDGEGCLEIFAYGSNGSILCFLKNFAIIPGNTYRVSVLVKTAKVDENTEVTLNLRWKDSKNLWMADFPYRRIFLKKTSDGEWSKLQGYITVPSQAKKLPAFLTVLLSCEFTTKGKVYFDNFILEQIINKSKD